MKDKIVGFFKKYVAPTDLTCSVCGRENFNGKVVCDDCLKGLVKIETPCEKCGRQNNFGAKLCKECSESEIEVTKAVSEYEYSGETAVLMRRFKYKGNKYLKDFFADGMIDAFFKAGITADTVTFVPMSRREYISRGFFNQAELLAKAFCSKTGLPLNDILVKNKHTVRQATLNYSERQKNLKGVFSVKKGINLKGVSVLVIDDVLTTGATADAVGKTLFDKGVKNVYFLTVASVTHK